MNINFTNLTKLVKPKGVIHVGANTCQELPLYLEHGIENRLWVEPNTNLEFPNGETIIHAAISDKIKANNSMYLANNNGESSSLLTPKKHLQLYENIDFNQNVLNCSTTTLENLIGNFLGQIENINYLVLDIQGAELKALQGLGKFVNHFDVIITEAYTEELYQDCGKLDEIEALLGNYKLIEFAEEVGKGWGDAAFVRKDLLV